MAAFRTRHSFDNVRAASALVLTICSSLTPPAISQSQTRNRLKPELRSIPCSGGSGINAVWKLKKIHPDVKSPSVHNSYTRIFRAVENKGVVPHLGHVSNFCGLKLRPLEPVQLLSDQGRARGAGAPVQTGYPAELLLELVRPRIFEQQNPVTAVNTTALIVPFAG